MRRYVLSSSFFLLLIADLPSSFFSSLLLAAREEPVLKISQRSILTWLLRLSSVIQLWAQYASLCHLHVSQNYFPNMMIFLLKFNQLEFQVPIDVFKGITDEDAAKVVDGLALKAADRQSSIEQIKKLYELFCKCDCTLLEVCSEKRFSFWLLILWFAFLLIWMLNVGR